MPQRVIDLVRAGVRQVFAFEVNLRAAEVVGEAARVGERRGPPHVVAHQLVKLRVKVCVVAQRAVSVFEFGQRRHERLRHELPAVCAELGRERAVARCVCRR